MPAPLHGLRVLDFSELLPGPFLTGCLAELGAEVLKVERPPAGDPVRRMSPGVFGAVNRGKRSAVIDLKQPEGRERALALAAEHDVLVESFRPGVMARLGLGYADLAAISPRLVYASLSGYGQDGPYAAVPGHDLNYLSVAGMQSISGGGAGVPVADLCGSVYGLAGVLAALVQRGVTGRGQFLDVSLTECALHWMNPRLGRFAGAGADTLEAQRRMSLARPGYGAFPCRDGRAISIGALEDHFWARLAAALRLAPFDTADHSRMAQRVPETEAINALIGARCAEEDSAGLLERLLAADVPAAPVLAPGELAGFPHFVARGAMQETEAGPLARFPVRLEGMEALGPAPALNAGTGR
ncbi:CaiB/BaiF CoA transferase family protein [Roseomonas populi]|uniref:CoA transferase n=1 Tax=Roseomonas populi TaxID=3121582 RepID=A0ABT1XD38_9PROT|nr:CaiB/BaiF CoA-transferase family protein [Roseomonas pecuniae]MCR0985666.1 CoA transferase [Roseomonas pecuniae]